MGVRASFVLGTAGLLVVASSALPAAAADTYACGGTIVASTTLTHDLQCDSGDGLVLGASGTDSAPIVLDLNGHTISGDGGPAGIRLTGQNNVVIRNGTIRGFGAGVELQQSTRVRVADLNVSAVYRGINVGGGGQHLIENNVITAEKQDGIRLGATSDNVIRHNTVTHSVWGISVAGFTTSNLVEENVVTDSQEHGIGAFGWARAVKLVGNLTSGSRDGIAIGHEVADAVIERNESFRNRDDGIQVDIPTTTLSDNIVTDNGDLGIEAVDGVSGSGNHAARNAQPAQCTGVGCSPVH